MKRVYILGGLLLLACSPLVSADDAQTVLDRATRVLASDPDNQKARYNRGWALSMMGKHAEAERDFRAVISGAEAGIKTDSLFNLGYVMFMQKNLQGALEAWKAGLRHAPHDRDMQYNYTVVRRMLQQQEEEKKNKKDEKQDQKDQEKKPGDSPGQDRPDQDNAPRETGKDQRRQRAAGSMSSEEALRLLRALQEQEQKANPQDRQILGGPRRGKDW